MITRIKSNHIIADTELVSGYVYFDNGRITHITAQDLPYDTEYDYTGYYVSPGFIDIHSHGGMGHEFFGSSEDIVEACNFHLSHGTTSICPTISAAPFDIMKNSVAEAKKAMSDSRLKEIGRAHV